MHIQSPVLGLGILFLSLFADSATATPAATASISIVKTPGRTLPAPVFAVTPAPAPDLVSHRLLGARQGSPRSSDGRTNFIGWYTVSDTWVSATCPSDDYFAADETYGVCCHRNNPYCDMATSCAGPNGNFAIGPSGQADCGPTNTCDTVTLLQTRDSTDARRIVFCIAVSELYVLPMTWYRVTYPLAQPSATTVTMTLSITVTAQPGNQTSGGRSESSPTSPPTGLALAAAALSFLMLLIA